MNGHSPKKRFYFLIFGRLYELTREVFPWKLKNWNENRITVIILFLSSFQAIPIWLNFKNKWIYRPSAEDADCRCTVRCQCNIKLFIKWMDECDNSRKSVRDFIVYLLHIFYWYICSSHSLHLRCPSSAQAHLNVLYDEFMYYACNLCTAWNAHEKIKSNNTKISAINMV